MTQSRPSLAIEKNLILPLRVAAIAAANNEMFWVLCAVEITRFLPRQIY